MHYYEVNDEKKKRRWKPFISSIVFSTLRDATPSDVQKIPACVKTLEFMNGKDELMGFIPETVEEVLIDNCIQTTNEGYKALNRNLKSLSLFSEVANITGQFLKNVPPSLTNLECGVELENSDLQWIPSTVVNLSLGIQSKLTSLQTIPKSVRSLKLYGCNKIDAVGLKFLPDHVKTLELNECELIDDNALLNLHANITDLNLECDNITGVGLANIARNLKKLSIKSGSSFTVEGIKVLSTISGIDTFEISPNLAPNALTKVVHFLPTSLTLLTVNDICHDAETFKKLSTNLRRLELQIVTNSIQTLDILSSLPTTLTELKLDSFMLPALSLPSNITTLDLFGCKFNNKFEIYTTSKSTF